MRLLEILSTLNRAGVNALQDCAGLTPTHCDVSLLRQRNLTMSHLVELNISGSVLQKIHLGCDEALRSHLGGGVESLAEAFFRQVAQGCGDRRPKASVSTRKSIDATLHTRGVRTFDFCFETPVGQFMALVEVPSRSEMENAMGTDYVESMEAFYLPEDWRALEEIASDEQVRNVFSFLEKIEGDIYLDVPAGDGTATVNSGLLLEGTTHEDRPVLKLCTDFSDPQLGIPAEGDLVRASVGLGDRSLECDLRYMGEDAHTLPDGAVLPCALFAYPGEIKIGQRRRSFRVSVPALLKVEMHCGEGAGDPSPWADAAQDVALVEGHLTDLSFSGARISADHEKLCSCYRLGSKVVCRIHFPEQGETVTVLGVVRRTTAGLKERHQWRDEIGIEFLVSPGMERSSLDFIRQYVLDVQRSNLASRLRLAGV